MPDRNPTLTNTLRQLQYVVINRGDSDSIGVGGPMSASGHRNSAFPHLHKTTKEAASDLRSFMNYIMSKLCAVSCGGFQYIPV